MNKSMIDHFRQTLKNHRDTVVQWFNNETNTEKIQACLCSENRTVAVNELDIIPQIDNALINIEHDKFGRCVVCNSEVEPERLELDFTTKVCLDCYSDKQLKDLERDLELAAKVHRQLMPSSVPPISGIQIAAHTKPHGIVGGDYFDFFNGKENTQGLIIADVMGKGLSASMLMANLQASLRILGPEFENMAELTSRINELFRYNLKLISFISLFIAKIDSPNKIFEYCNAGHNPPVWRKASDGSITLLNPTGPAIGLMHNPEFKSEKIKFNSGDLIMLYTDGLVEAKNNGHEFGKERLFSFIDKHADKSAEEILLLLKESVMNFAGGGTCDDMTLLVVKIL